MTKLIAEQRLDKNGKLVTRHVLAATNDDSKASRIPTPVTPATPKLPVTKGEYAKEIADFLLEGAEDVDRKEVALSMSTNLGIRPLMLIHERMHDTDEWDGELLGLALELIMDAKDNTGEKLPQHLKDNRAAALVESLPVIKGFCDLQVHPRVVADIASTVAYAAKVNYVKMNSPYVTDEDRSVLRYFAFEAIVKKTSFAHDRESLLENAEWFDENREELSTHAAMIRGRGVTDRELLESFISKDGHRVLAEGSL